MPCIYAGKVYTHSPGALLTAGCIQSNKCSSHNNIYSKRSRSTQGIYAVTANTYSLLCGKCLYTPPESELYLVKNILRILCEIYLKTCIVNKNVKYRVCAVNLSFVYMTCQVSIHTDKTTKKRSVPRFTLPTL